MKLYVDGQLASEQPFSGVLASGGTSFQLAIPSGSADRLNGIIDEVRIYNKVIY